MQISPDFGINRGPSTELEIYSVAKFIILMGNKTLKCWVMNLVTLLLIALILYIQVASGSLPNCCSFDRDCCERSLRLAATNVAVIRKPPPPETWPFKMCVCVDVMDKFMYAHVKN